MVLELKKNISKTYSRSSIRSENALKYSNSPHIIVETGTEESDYFISVKDNGIGIEKKYIKDIFKKFYPIGKRFEIFQLTPYHSRNRNRGIRLFYFSEGQWYWN